MPAGEWTIDDGGTPRIVVGQNAYLGVWAIPEESVADQAGLPAQDFATREEVMLIDSPMPTGEWTIQDGASTRIVAGWSSTHGLWNPVEIARPLISVLVGFRSEGWGEFSILSWQFGAFRSEAESETEFTAGIRQMGAFRSEGESQTQFTAHIRGIYKFSAESDTHFLAAIRDVMAMRSEAVGETRFLAHLGGVMRSEAVSGTQFVAAINAVPPGIGPGDPPEVANQLNYVF